MSIIEKKINYLHKLNITFIVFSDEIILGFNSIDDYLNGAFPRIAPSTALKVYKQLRDIESKPNEHT